MARYRHVRLWRTLLGALLAQLSSPSYLAAQAEPTSAEPHASEALAEPVELPLPSDAAPAVALADMDPQPLKGPGEFALTISGGVSLGSYEAGIQYFLGEAIKRAGHTLTIATGASAGSANALTAVMQSCLPPQPDPTAALGYDVWVPVGVNELYVPERVQSDALFTRGALRASLERLKQVWMQGLPDTCRVQYGVSVTYNTPERYELRQNGRPVLQVQKQVENFTFNIEGRGPGRPPRIRPAPIADAHIPQTYLPLERSDDDAAQLRNFDRIVELLFASSAFPLAFRPQPLEVCRQHNHNGSAKSPTAANRPPECRKAVFVDGGLFDNTPLRLAARLARANQGQTGGTRSALKRQPTRFLYIDPGTHTYPHLDPPEEPTSNRRNALDVLKGLAENFISTSRSRELYALLEDGMFESLAGRVALTSNYLPVASGNLAGFFGFFERDFRIFDFYVGMYDSYIDLHRYVLKHADSPQTWNAESLTELFPVLQDDDPSTIPTGFRPFACMLSQLSEDYPGYQVVCAEPELRNFSILLQVAMDRLYSACHRDKAHVPDLDTQLDVCMAAVRGAAPQTIAGLPEMAFEARLRNESEDDLHHTLRLLSAYGFHFRDMGLSRAEADQVPKRLRGQVLELAQALAQAQDSTVQSTVVGESGRFLANSIYDQRPPFWAYFTVGTAVEFGLNFLPFIDWLRLNAALQLKELDTLSTPKRITVGVTPAIGLDTELTSLSTSALRTSMGLRTGFQFGASDRFGARNCSDRVTGSDPRDCTQWVLQQYTSLALLERLRLQLTIEYFPQKRVRRYDSSIATQLSFGMQFF